MSKLLLAPCFVVVQEKTGLCLLCYFMIWGRGIILLSLNSSSFCKWR